MSGHTMSCIWTHKIGSFAAACRVHNATTSLLVSILRAALVLMCERQHVVGFHNMPNCKYVALFCHGQGLDAQLPLKYAHCATAL